MLITIDRSKWLTADTRYSLGPSYLCDNNDNMCCLGFICAAEKISLHTMRGLATPRGLASIISEKSVPKALFDDGGNTDLTVSAIVINDKDTLSSKARELELKKLFEADGTYTIEFVGNYPLPEQENQ